MWNGLNGTGRRNDIHSAVVYIVAHLTWPTNNHTYLETNLSKVGSDELKITFCHWSVSYWCGNLIYSYLSPTKIIPYPCEGMKIEHEQWRHVHQNPNCSTAITIHERRMYSMYRTNNRVTWQCSGTPSVFWLGLMLEDEVQWKFVPDFFQDLGPNVHSMMGKSWNK